MIIKEESMERRIGERMPLKTNLIIKSYSSHQEIDNAMIVNISEGGMHFFIPVDYLKLRNHEICTFIFDLPPLGKTYVLGEIYDYLDLVDPTPPKVLHYRTKFINLSMNTWNHIKNCCRNKTEIPGDHPLKYSLEVQKTSAKITSTTETLTIKTLALIEAQTRLENGPTLQGKIKDIDFGGILLELSKPIPANTNLRVDISFEELTFSANCICNQCDNKDQGTDLFFANICFNDIEQEQFEHLKSLMMKLATYMADWILKSHDSLSSR